MTNPFAAVHRTRPERSASWTSVICVLIKMPNVAENLLDGGFPVFADFPRGCGPDVSEWHRPRDSRIAHERERSRRHHSRRRGPTDDQRFAR